jgi:serine/threonine-protein kinase
MPLQPGDTVERYVIEGLIGAGGMGEVYRARDERLQRRVALKVLREEVVEGTGGSKRSSGGGARMLREARAAAALDHPNVVAMFDVGQIEAPGPLQGMTYLAMELIKGVPLRAYVGDARVPFDQRLRWLVDVARALFEAHQHGIVHRDVKPENVMVREDGHVKVLDFGIARATQGKVDPQLPTQQAAVHVTSGSMAAGTPMYMAPEQLRVEPLDGRADQFGWGVMAYELLTGRLPWSSERGPTALLSQVLTEMPARPDAVAEGVPVRVADVVMRALAKAAADRFPTMGELLGALGADAGPAVTVPPPLASGDALAATQLATSTPAVRRSGGAARSEFGSHVTPPPNSNVTPPAAPQRRPGLRAATATMLVLLVAGSVVGARALRRRSAGTAQSSPSVAPAALAGCSTNQGCIDAHGGAPWICRADRTCVALESEDCKVLAEPGDVAKDTTVWIGAVYPTGGADGAMYAPDVRGVDLARRDFAEALAPVHDAPRIAVLSCDGHDHLDRVARHLAEEVRVPASLLAGEGADEVIANVFTPDGVLTMLPLDVRPNLTELPSGAHGRLVWRSVYGIDSTVRATAALIEQYLEPRLRAERHGARTRVALLRAKVLSERAVTDPLLHAIHVNGAPLSEQAQDFLELPISGKDPLAPSVETLLRFAPSVVLFMPSLGVRKCVAAAIEAQSKQGLPPPVYLYPTALPPDLLESVAHVSPRSRRILALDQQYATVPSQLAATHFSEAFGEEISAGHFPAYSYDGTYALAYAVYASGRAHPTGDDLARALARLRGPGKVAQVGSQAILEGYSALTSGRAIDLEGVAGHLELDPETGESSFDMKVLCAAKDPSGRLENLPSGLWYDGRAQKLRGDFTCF